jgi:ATP-binding cassette subfamily C protein LapB
VVAELRDGQLMVIEHFNGEDTLDVFIIADEGQRNRLTLAELLPEIVHYRAAPAVGAEGQSGRSLYFALQPDWMRELVLKTSALTCRS